MKFKVGDIVRVSKDYINSHSFLNGLTKVEGRIKKLDEFGYDFEIEWEIDTCHILFNECDLRMVKPAND